VIIHLVGGQSDGERIDTDDPATSGLARFFAIPLPEIIHCQSKRGVTAAYRLHTATSDECTYVIDPDETATYRLSNA
jgi:hypothetical protein